MSLSSLGAYYSVSISCLPPPENTDSQTLDVKLLLASFIKIEPQADAFATTFYDVLFLRYPKVKPLFSATDMGKQKAKLIESLQIVMGNIHNPEAFTTILRNLGKRHVGYGAVLTDYPLIGDALLQALQKHLGHDWTPDVERTWTLAYQTIAEIMSEGAKTVTGNIDRPIAIESVSGIDSSLPKSDRNLESDKDRSSNSGNNSTLFTLIILMILGTAAIGYIFIKPTLTEPTPVEQRK